MIPCNIYYILWKLIVDYFKIQSCNMATWDISLIKAWLNQAVTCIYIGYIIFQYDGCIWDHLRMFYHIVDCLVTVLTWDSNTFHINVDVFGYKVVIIADHEVETILFVPLFHLFLCFSNLVIICTALKFDTKPRTMIRRRRRRRILYLSTVVSIIRHIYNN